MLEFGGPSRRNVDTAGSGRAARPRHSEKIIHHGAVEGITCQRPTFCYLSGRGVIE
jgi:hypothetical protein